MPLLSNLRAARERSGQRVGEFASSVNVSRSHMINMENGSREASPAVAHRIAMALGVTVEYLEDKATVPESPPPQPSRPAGPPSRKDDSGPPRAA